MKKYCLVLCCWFSILGFSQSTYLNLEQGSYQKLDRLEIKKGNLDGIHSSFKPYRASSLNIYGGDSLGEIDAFNYNFLQENEWLSTDSVSESKKAVLRHFYKNPYSFYHVNTDALKLSVNPVLYFQMGKDFKNDLSTSINTRGLEIKGMIDNKVGFYSFIGENQFFAPTYVSNRIAYNRAIPGEGFWKVFKDTGYDFFTSRAYIDFNVSKHIYVQLGQDQNFVGNGYRSLILSNHAGSYPFAKIQTKLWKFNYTNLFAKLTADVVSTGGGASAGSQVYPHKWLSFHHLSLNVTKNINIGVFESVMSGAADSTGRSNFEIDYLNPVIFYRSVEQNLGSSGNALIGLDFKWNFLKHFSFYGQVVMDEFHLESIKARDGWWANKYGVQYGLKYIDIAGISNLDLQVEHNFVRPFTYTHASNYTSYSHYRTELAHPLGANFKDYIAILRYQPLAKLNLTATLIYSIKGEDDSLTIAQGGDILKSYNLRAKENGNEIGQGVLNTTTYMSFVASYMFKPNMFLDMTAIARTETSESATESNNVFWLSLGLRMNIAARQFDY